MKNPLVDRVENEFKRLDFPRAELVSESYAAESFGNAVAVYRINNLYFYFICDRGNDMIDWISDRLTNKKEIYGFSDISLLMGWETLDEMVSKYKYTNIDFSKPPSDPIPLGEMLRVIKKDFDQLQVMFSPSKLDNTLKQLKEICRKRCKALFDSEPRQ